MFLSILTGLRVKRNEIIKVMSPGQEIKLLKFTSEFLRLYVNEQYDVNVLLLKLAQKLVQPSTACVTPV